MQIYSFIAEGGEPRELLFSMDNAPMIGDTIEDADGVKVTRVPEATKGAVRDYTHVAHGLPRVDPSAPYWPHYNEKRQPVCTNKQQVAELSARTGGTFVYD